MERASYHVKVNPLLYVPCFYISGSHRLSHFNASMNTGVARGLNKAMRPSIAMRNVLRSRRCPTPVAKRRESADRPKPALFQYGVREVADELAPYATCCRSLLVGSHALLPKTKVALKSQSLSSH
jgi:hypothetical protein